MQSFLYEVKGAQRFFQRGQTTIEAVGGVDLEIGAGEFVALEGPSGSGKTTLLQLLGALDRPVPAASASRGETLGCSRTASWPTSGSTRSVSSSSSSI